MTFDILNYLRDVPSRAYSYRHTVPYYSNLNNNLMVFDCEIWIQIG